MSSIETPIVTQCIPSLQHHLTTFFQQHGLSDDVATPIEHIIQSLTAALQQQSSDPIVQLIAEWHTRHSAPLVPQLYLEYVHALLQTIRHSCTTSLEIHIAHNPMAVPETFATITTLTTVLDEAYYAISQQVVGELATHATNEHITHINFYHTLVEHSPDAIGITTPDGNIMYANPAYHTMLGYEQLVGTSILDSYDEDPNHLIQLVQQVQTSGEWHGTLTYKRRDGTTFEGFLTAFAIRDDDGTPIAVGGIFRDISHHAKIEEKLQQHKRLTQEIVNNMPAVVFAKDPDGKILLVNQQWCYALQLPADTVIGKYEHELFPKEQYEVWNKISQHILKTGIPYEQTEDFTQEGVVYTYHSIQFPIKDQHGTIVALAGISYDITEQKKLERSLHMFKALVERAPDGINIVNMDGHVLYANPAHVAMFGYGNDTIGMHVGQFSVPTEHAKVETAMQQLMRDGFWQGEIEHIRADGTLFPSLVSSFLIINNENDTDFHNAIALGAIVRDTTELRRAEQDRVAFQQQIIDAQRDALRELSSPIIPIDDNVLIMPLIGSIDTQRAQQIMEDLLEGVAGHHADVVIVDITGMSVVDTQVANALVQVAQAVRLLGAHIILTGIGPSMAQTLVGLGADLSSIITKGNLKSGIAYAMKMR